MKQRYGHNIRSSSFRSFSVAGNIEAFNAEFMPGDHIWLFGSRVKMQKRGGDIDLYIETNSTSAQDAYQRETKFISKVWDRIGEQKIDIVLNLLALDGDQLPIYNVARTNGVQLV